MASNQIGTTKSALAAALNTKRPNAQAGTKTAEKTNADHAAPTTPATHATADAAPPAEGHPAPAAQSSPPPGGTTMTQDAAPHEPATTPNAPPKRRGPFAEFWFYFSENTGALIGFWVFVAFILIAIFAPLLAPYPADAQFRDALLMPPVWQEGGSWDYILGTDPLGRDMLSRILVGSRYSFFVGLVVVLVATTGGVIVGLIAGFAPSWLDTIIMRVMDVILAFPSLLMALVLVAVLGPSLINAMIAIAIVLQPHYVRLTRAAVLSEKNKDYVTSARVAGASKLRLMFVTVLPNCLAPIIVQAALSFSTAILDAAALGFLGMGAQPPTPEWGTMLAESREFILRAPWVVAWPGVAILITVLAINLMGDGLRDALDPKLKRS